MGQLATQAEQVLAKPSSQRTVDDLNQLRMLYGLNSELKNLSGNICDGEPLDLRCRVGIALDDPVMIKNLATVCKSRDSNSADYTRIGCHCKGSNMNQGICATMFTGNGINMLRKEIGYDEPPKTEQTAPSSSPQSPSSSGTSTSMPRPSINTKYMAMIVIGIILAFVLVVVLAMRMRNSGGDSGYYQNYYYR